MSFLLFFALKIELWVLSLAKYFRFSRRFGIIVTLFDPGLNVEFVVDFEVKKNQARRFG